MVVASRSPNRSRGADRRRAVVPSTLLLIAVASGVRCRATTLDLLTPRTHSIADASVGGSATDSGPALECAEGISANQACEYSSQCCSGLCDLDYLATLTCRPTPGCLGVARSCSLAAECCSLGCDAVDGGGGTCIENALCSVIGADCVANRDCCSNLCDAGACADPGPMPPEPRCGTAGEVCGAGADCCGQVCNSSIDERQRCQLLAGCRVQGELCVSAEDCCSGLCSAEKPGISRCAAPGPCTLGDVKACSAQVGDICKNSDECCSHVCIATSDGLNRCAPSPGCRPACDLCVQNADCCSNNCAVDSDGVSRCVRAGDCQPEGETCTRDDQCCQTTSKMRCVEEPKGLKGKRCVIDDPGAACLSDGAACALASRCCGGHCLPSSHGGFACASACATEGQLCTSRADCCGAHADCLAIEGQRACRELIR